MGINGYPGPAIIISAAGMAEAGRVLHHLRNHVGDERNTILIVGFMAQHTLGRRRAGRRPRVKIWGVERDLYARVEVLSTAPRKSVTTSRTPRRAARCGVPSSSTGSRSSRSRCGRR